MKYDEKRAFMRINLESEIHYRLVESDEFHAAKCTSLSGSGVSFITSTICAEGEALEIKITPQNGVTPSFVAFVEVVRVLPITEKNMKLPQLLKQLKAENVHNY